VAKMARYTLAEVDFESLRWRHEGCAKPPSRFAEERKAPATVIEKGKLPAWFPEVVHGKDATIPVHRRQESCPFSCAGTNRNKSMTLSMYNTL